MQVTVARCTQYEPGEIEEALRAFRPLFEQTIRRGDTVVLKPNWIAHRHKHRPHEWRSVITSPEVITGVLQIVLDCLQGSGRVVITDGPQTDSSWSGLMERMEPSRWEAMGRAAGVEVSVLDLREHEWTTKGDVNIGRRQLPGDPLGSTSTDLGLNSEFVGHQRSTRGYYGADYDVSETNAVHANERHMYKVSRTVLSADVFVNLPKMKTHKKAGITCSLKNLVGINTYKNWLPHHNEGTPAEGGDQFPTDSKKRKVEGVLTDRFKAVLWSHPALGRWLIPVKFLGRKIFGDTQQTIRSGNWYGNDTLWRMVLDLNKVLAYANSDGTLRADALQNRKRYLSIVDGVIAGEGNGPEAPDAKACGVLIGGTNPVAVDAVCAKIMGFDWQRIPCIRRAFEVARYRLCDFSYDAILVDGPAPFRGRLRDLSFENLAPFRPHFGWLEHVELPRGSSVAAEAVHASG
jgi:uncharacterized protein (DUF362 family)